MAEDTSSTDDSGDDSGATDDSQQNLADPGKKALREERAAKRKAEKERDDLTAELDKLRKASQSDQERLLDEAKTAAAEEAAGPLRLENARLAVALEKGLTLTQAKRLVGNTAEELAADADALLEEFGGQKQQSPPFNGGPRPPAKGGDMNSLIRRAAGVG